MRADFITSEVVAAYPTAGCLAPEWWESVRLGPCDCDRHRAEQARDVGADAIDTHCLRQMFDAGVLRWVDTAAPSAPHHCGRAFARPDGRVIFHPAHFNENPASAPPPLALPSPRLVCEALHEATFVFIADLKSWYYQVPIPATARAAFRWWVRDGSTWRQAELTRLAMGWRGSAAAADSATRAIAGVPAHQQWDSPDGIDSIVYIDDVACTSRAAAERFRRGVSRAGVELKSESETTSGLVLFIGIQLRIPGGMFRVAPRLLGKLQRAARRFRPLSSDSARRRLAGLCVAVLERAGMCLATGREVWDLTLPGRQEGVPPRGGEALASSALKAILRDAALWRSVVAPTAVCYGASDASNLGWGWIWRDSPAPRWGQGNWRAPLHINFLEAIALLRAVRQAPPASELRIYCDNEVVVRWVSKGTSRVKFACTLILRIERVLIEKGCRLLAQYIPSHLNIADGLSRGDASPASFTLPPWQVSYPRRVLGWAAPQTSPRPACEDVREASESDSASSAAWEQTSLDDAWGGGD